MPGRNRTADLSADAVCRAATTVLLLLAAAPAPTMAQTAAPSLQEPGALRPPRRRPLDLPPPPAEDFELPAEPFPPGFPLAPAGPWIVVRRFEFRGNTVIADDELDSIARPYLDRPVGTEDLEALRQALTRLYVDRGYLNSGAILPDQRISDAMVVYEIIEGRLTDIDVRGTGRLVEDYVEDRLRLGAGPPLNVDDLRDRFRILLQDPLIARLEGEIRPGVRRGEARLDVAVEREKPYEIAVSFDNHRNPAVGELQGTVDATLRNLTGRGDAVRGVFQRSEGAWDVFAEGSIPLTAWDTRLHLAYERTRSEVVEEPGQEFNIKAEEEHYRLGLRQPLWLTANDEIGLGIDFEYEESTTFLFGDRFSFSPGAENGRTRVAALRLSQEYTHRGLEDAIALRSTISRGLDILDATDHSTDPDGEFTAWLGQLYWQHRFDERGDGAILRAEAQLTPSKLPTLEQYELGGANSVRGYRENILVGDEAFFASLEGRIVVTRFGIPELRIGPEDGVLTLAPFLDWGRAADNDGESESLYSVGLGALIDLGRWFHVEVYYGRDLKTIETLADDSLQDDGIHLQAVLRY
jgi:hemolysin activation/secretion protein